MFSALRGPKGSLERQLQLALAVSVLLVMTGFWIFGHFAVRQIMESALLARLQHDTDALRMALQFDDQGRPRIGWRRITPVYHQRESGHYFVLETADGQRLRSWSLGDDQLHGPELAPGETRSWRSNGVEGQFLLVWSAGYVMDGRPFTLRVAEDVSGIRQSIRRLEWLYAVAMAFFLLVALAVNHWIIRRAFQGFLPLLAELERLEAGKAEALSSRAPPEIQPLVDAFNRVFVGLLKGSERTRNAAGNLAHALKTPLAVMQQTLDSEPFVAMPEARAAMLKEVQRIKELTRRELKRARIAGSGIPGRSFTPVEELPVLAQLMEKVHYDKSIQVEARYLGRQTLDADREDMLEMGANLLDNAYKWAASAILLQSECKDGAWRLQIDDDGPGCSPEDMHAISQRGARIDEGREGDGLGLSIVQEIVVSYQGSCVFSRSSSLGGLSVTVTIPNRCLSSAIDQPVEKKS